MRKTIDIKNGVTRNPAWAMKEPVNLTLLEGEQWAVVGRNGAGKTMLTDILTGRHPLLPDTVSYDFGDSQNHYVSDNIRYISFRDTYGGDNDRTYFLQQRWNQMEIDEETPTVVDKLEEAYRMAGEDTPSRRRQQRHLYELFHMEPLLDKYIILLSSGELRKFKLVSSLFCQPRVLVIDNPFIGLDKETRQQLNDLLASLTRNLQLILVLSRPDETPAFITHVVEVEDMKVKGKRPFTPVRHTLPPPVIVFHNVNIRYGSRTILRDLNWTVRQGEHWALTGQNGSGKSTLLSLVCADNPQSYACDITLFGHRRGSGESIWDIKRHIGYVSPEMHRAYQKNLPCIQIVASGLKDSVGLYVRPSEEEKAVCRQWMDTFGLAGLYERPFLQLSSGQQRLVLLARAFVKDPQLLILDEPLHGLDDVNRQLVRDIIEDFCRRPDKTLIMVSHYEEELPPCIDHHLVLQSAAS